MRLWIDLVSGTCGDADDLFFLNADDWSEDEFDAFFAMNDNDRVLFAYEISELQGETNGN